jgi:hypothetical protein
MFIPYNNKEISDWILRWGCVSPFINLCFKLKSINENLPVFQQVVELPVPLFSLRIIHCNGMWRCTVGNPPSYSGGPGSNVSPATRHPDWHPLQFSSLFPWSSKLARETTLLNCIRQMPCSKLDRQTKYRDWGRSWLSSVRLGKCYEHFLTHHFQCTLH